MRATHAAGIALQLYMWNTTHLFDSNSHRESSNSLKVVHHQECSSDIANVDARFVMKAPARHDLVAKLAMTLALGVVLDISNLGCQTMITNARPC